MASASDHRAHAALQPADCLILLPQRLPAAVETSIRPAHYPAECTQSDAFLQPSLRARKGRANSNSFPSVSGNPGRNTIRHRPLTLSLGVNNPGTSGDRECPLYVPLPRAAISEKSPLAHLV